MKGYQNHSAMKSLFSIALAILIGYSVRAQKPTFSPLFSDDTPVNIRLKMSIKEVRKQTNDTTYMEDVLYYQNENGVWDSLDVKIRTRGDFRLKQCYYAPLRIKIKKKVSKGTLFEGNKALKLVLPCNRGGDCNELVVKEFMCYRLYEAITPYTFSTRLVNIDLHETSGKKVKNHQLKGFFIEDDDLVAERFNATVKKELSLHPLALHDTSTIQHDFFQYLIANIDWSTTYKHNEKIILAKDPVRYIPLTYDFDMSGFVNASYAVLNPQFDMDNVRDRIYRGFCRKNNDVVFYVREQFIRLEQTMYDIMAVYKDMLDERDYNSLVKFVEGFYKTFKDDKSFKLEILDKCRRN